MNEKVSCSVLRQKKNQPLQSVLKLHFHSPQDEEVVSYIMHRDRFHFALWSTSRLHVVSGGVIMISNHKLRKNMTLLQLGRRRIAN